MSATLSRINAMTQPHIAWPVLLSSSRLNALSLNPRRPRWLFNVTVNEALRGPLRPTSDNVETLNAR
eukprot:11224096-Lingulodinium_polyedra.AAC.1